MPIPLSWTVKRHALPAGCAEMLRESAIQGVQEGASILAICAPWVLAVQCDRRQMVGRKGQAVSESLVLLKNDNKTLPLSRSLKTIFVAGQAADDIGIQSGGWTITWQGEPGDITPGYTILQGIGMTVSPSTTVFYDAKGQIPSTEKMDACIVAIGELPYAEGVGDKADLSISASDAKMTADLRPRCEKLIVVLISGRPMVVTDQLPGWDAFVAAWLPDALIKDMTYGHVFKNSAYKGSQKERFTLAKKELKAHLAGDEDAGAVGAGVV